MPWSSWEISELLSGSAVAARLYVEGKFTCPGVVLTLAVVDAGGSEVMGNLGTSVPS